MFRPVAIQFYGLNYKKELKQFYKKNKLCNHKLQEYGLCNAHHLRELQWVIDLKNQKWARSLKNF